VLLRHYLEQGLLITAIAETLQVNRRTIHRWVAAGEVDRDPTTMRYGSRAPIPTKLDPYKALIEERLGTYPELTAVRLFEQVRAAGYPRSLSQLKVFVRRVRPRPEPEPLVRFEIPPGKQGQVDFAEIRLPWGKRFALMVILGYSRFLWLQVYARQTMGILPSCSSTSWGHGNGRRTRLFVPEAALFSQVGPHACLALKRPDLLGGHCKTGHHIDSQNRPPRASDRDWVSDLLRRWVGAQVGGHLGPPAPGAALEDVGVVE